MSRLAHRVWVAIANRFRGRRFEAELDRELASAVEELTGEGLATGLSPEEARRRALLALGGVEQVKEAVRAERGGVALERLAHDARFALRALRRAPAYATAALLTLGLGIGGATAVFSVVRAVLRAPAYPGAERLVHIWATWPGGSGNLGYPDFRALAEHARAFESVAAYESWGGVSLIRDGRAVRLATSFVSTDYLPMLGAAVERGRGFAAEENAMASGRAVAILSHACWQRDFGGDESVLGSVIRLNRAPYTVIGVLSPSFRDLGQAESGTVAPDVWLPAASAPALLGQAPLTDAYSIYWAVARLRPGVSLTEARADLERIAAARAHEDPVARARHGLALQPLRERLAGPATRPAWLLFGAATLILLLGCVNLASASLVRLERRRAELAVRSALGASTGRLVQQLVVEAGVLALSGAVTGLALATLLTRWLGAWVQAHVAALVEQRVDGGVLLCAATLAVGTMALFGVVPALAFRSTELRAALARGGSRSASAGPSRLRRGMAVVQVALAATLLVGAGLMGRSLTRLLGQGMGYDTADLLTLRIDLSGERYADGAARIRFADGLESELGTVPGARSVTLWGPSMLANATWVVSVFPEERVPGGPEAFVQAFRHSVNAGALGHLGIPLRAGRELLASDRATAPLVAVISESLAKELWPGEVAVGKRLRRVDPALPPIEVVGVAADAQHRDRYSLDDLAAGIGPCGLGPQRDVYLPYAQRPNPSLTLAVRFSGEAAGMEQAVKRAVAHLDADVAVSDVMLLDQRLRRQESAPAAITLLFAAFATFAGFLAALGLYGVVAQSLELRTRELGIRLALGAQAGRLVRREVASGLGLAAGGAVLGIAGGLILGRFMSALLFGVGAADPATLCGVTGALLGLAAATTYWPARRVIRRGALRALRLE